MERRSEPRFGADHTVRVTLLGDDEETLDGRMVNVSGRGMRIILDRPLALNAAIRVDCSNSIYLGDVCYVEQQDKAYAIGLSLDQAVHDLAQLTKLTAALLDEMHENDRDTCYSRR